MIIFIKAKDWEGNIFYINFLNIVAIKKNENFELENFATIIASTGVEYYIDKLTYAKLLRLHNINFENGFRGLNDN